MVLPYPKTQSAKTFALSLYTPKFRFAAGIMRYPWHSFSLDGHSHQSSCKFSTQTTSHPPLLHMSSRGLRQASTITDLARICGTTHRPFSLLLRTDKGHQALLPHAFFAFFVVEAVADLTLLGVSARLLTPAPPPFLLFFSSSWSSASSRSMRLSSC